jgi:D-beta-D-heptose 7-phosphate kinase / D-beta-D-heptose 1-phosphate adenosyltransferase
MNIDFAKFDKCRLLVVGDLMIDEYVWGQVDRISPEAPVQVVSVLRDSTTLGGAGNVVNNLAALGAQVVVAGVVGSGAHSDLLIRMCRKLGVDTSGLIRDPHRPTTRKTRIIGGHQHVLRIDREKKQPISESQRDALIDFVKDRIESFDLVLMSDYGKGLLSEELIRQIIHLSTIHDKPVIVDPKGLAFEKYAGATAITPNKKEASLASGIEIVDNESLDAAGAKLLEKTGVEKVLITCGKDDMILFENGQKPYRISAEARQVFDVSGAGDTVLAVLGLGLASGGSFRQAATLANVAGRIVVGKVGTATVSIEELRKAVDPSEELSTIKQKTQEDLVPIVTQLKAEGKTIVLTNGCFDVLHVGHVKLFDASKKKGDVLIVAIDDDDSVRALKGKGRPVISEQERVRIISAMNSVDYVTVFSTKALEGLLEAIRPDVLTKGSNYSRRPVLGREIVERSGGKVALVPMTEAVSSTQVINQIKKGSAKVR